MISAEPMNQSKKYEKSILSLKPIVNLKGQGIFDSQMHVTQCINTAEDGSLATLIRTLPKGHDMNSGNIIRYSMNSNDIGRFITSILYYSDSTCCVDMRVHYLQGHTINKALKKDYLSVYLGIICVIWTSRLVL